MVRRLYLALGVAVVGGGIAILGAFYALQFGLPAGAITDLTWEKTGGILGLRETLIIRPDGTVIYTSSHFGSTNSTLDRAEVTSLFEQAGALSLETYEPKGGVADFFSYRLILPLRLGR